MVLIYQLRNILPTPRVTCLDVWNTNGCLDSRKIMWANQFAFMCYKYIIFGAINLPSNSVCNITDMCIALCFGNTPHYSGNQLNELVLFVLNDQILKIIFLEIVSYLNFITQLQVDMYTSFVAITLLSSIFLYADVFFRKMWYHEPDTCTYNTEYALFVFTSYWEYTNITFGFIFERNELFYRNALRHVGSYNYI